MANSFKYISEDNNPDFSPSTSDLIDTGNKYLVKVNADTGQTNLLVFYDNNVHAHAFYDPQNCRSGYHGENVETRGNHPQQNREEMGEKTSIETGEKETLEDMESVDDTAPDEEGEEDGMGM